MMKQFYVYILCSKRNGTIYGFSKKYGTHCLVWYERHETAESAIVREKQIK